MRRVLTVTKTTRVLKVREILSDMLSDLPDEEIMEKHGLHWEQLEKIYAKLYYGGYLGKEDVTRRVELRRGKDAAHIPFAQIEDGGTLYECSVCGFISSLHFSTCPRCREVNLRRLTRRIPNSPASPAHAEGSAY
jgi:hypothetical protein